MELIELKFHDLDLGLHTDLDAFYTAHICIVDFSVPEQQASLFYHVGVRESTGQKESIVLVEDLNHDKTTSLKVIVALLIIIFF